MSKSKKKTQAELVDEAAEAQFEDINNDLEERTKRLEEDKRKAQEMRLLETIREEAKKLGGKQASVSATKIDISQNDRDVDLTSDDFIALKESIETDGLIQAPTLVVQENEDLPFLCVAGHRRILAMKELGYEKIPCVILSLTPSQIKTARFAENIVRQNLKPLEMANALKKLQLDLDVSTKGLARILNKDRPYVSRILRMADWPYDVQQMIKENNINMRPLFQLASQNLPEDKVRIEIQNLIAMIKEGGGVHSASPLKDRKGASSGKYLDRREKYFRDQAIPDSAKEWILKFLKENKIKGWFEEKEEASD